MIIFPSNRQLLVACILILTCSNQLFAANPVVRHLYTADPTIRFFQDRFWLYTTHDKETPTTNGNLHFLNWYDPGPYRAFSSVDMKEWTDHGPILSIDDIQWATEQPYAFDIIERNGTYYLYFSFVGDNKSIGVATSQKPDGPFTDAIGKPLLHQDMHNAPCETIDAGLFIDDNGQAYLTYGNDDPFICLIRGTEKEYTGQKAPRMVKLKDNMVELDGGIRVVEGISDFFEGPAMHKRNGLYYLIYASNGAWSDISYASSNTPLGPYTMQGIIDKRPGLFTPGSPLLISNHAAILDHDGASFYVYHTAELSGGINYRRSVSIDPISYDKDGKINPVTRTFMGVDDALRVNVGERSVKYSYQDQSGKTWYRDRNYYKEGDDSVLNNQHIYITRRPISNTLDDSLYQVQRYSNVFWPVEQLGNALSALNKTAPKAKTVRYSFPFHDIRMTTEHINTLSTDVISKNTETRHNGRTIQGDHIIIRMNVSGNMTQSTCIPYWWFGWRSHCWNRQTPYTVQTTSHLPLDAMRGEIRPEEVYFSNTILTALGLPEWLLALINTFSESWLAQIIWGVMSPLMTALEHPHPLEYFFKVPNGQYDVTLHFAETFFTEDNQRIFHIDIENDRVLGNLDVHAVAHGHDRALTQTFTVHVTDGQLDIALVPEKGLPMMAGIEVIRQSLH